MVEEENEVVEVSFPAKVREAERLHVILLGPEKCGKTTVANYLASEHQRCVVRLDQLFDYSLKRGLPVAAEAQAYLQEKAEELQTKQDEAAKKKKGKKTDAEPELNPAEFRYLPQEMIISMLKERIS